MADRLDYERLKGFFHRQTLASLIAEKFQEGSRKNHHWGSDEMI